MAAKEPVPARSSTSRTRPPLPPPRAASLCATPSLRGARTRGHAPDTPLQDTPRPQAREPAERLDREKRARAREHGSTRRALGALGTSLLQGSRGAGRPHPRSHRATAAGRCRAGSLRPLFAFLFLLPHVPASRLPEFCPEGIDTGATLPECHGHLVFS